MPRTRLVAIVKLLGVVVLALLAFGLGHGRGFAEGIEAHRDFAAMELLGSVQLASLMHLAEEDAERGKQAMALLEGSIDQLTVTLPPQGKPFAELSDPVKKALSVAKAYRELVPSAGAPVNEVLATVPASPEGEPCRGPSCRSPLEILAQARMEASQEGGPASAVKSSS